MGGPPLQSLVKYDTPSLLTTKDKKAKGGAKGGKNAGAAHHDAVLGVGYLAQCNLAIDTTVRRFATIENRVNDGVRE